MTLASRADRFASVRLEIEEASSFDWPCGIMNFLATVVACYGLLVNGPAIVIGAMILAMLLGPISGVALALVDGDSGLLHKALTAEIGGVLVVLTTSIVLGAVHNDIPITAEIMKRTAPNFFELMIALAGGAVGAYASISPRLSIAFIGVALATALVPPLASCGLLLARGEVEWAEGAFLLAFVNIVGIQSAASFVIWVSGERQTEQAAGVQHHKHWHIAVLDWTSGRKFSDCHFRAFGKPGTPRRRLRNHAHDARKRQRSPSRSSSAGRTSLRRRP